MSRDDSALGVVILAGVAYLLWARSAPVGNGLGRNLTAEEAEALDMTRTLQPPIIVPVPRQVPPWVEKTAGSQPFNQQNTAGVTIPAIGAEVTVVTFTVPPRKNGLIQNVSNQFVGGGWTEGSGDLVWRIEADGVPLQGLHNIIASMGSMSNPADFGQNNLAIYENQVIALIALNVAVPAAGQRLLGQFRGRYYPIEQEGQNTWL